MTVLGVGDEVGLLPAEHAAITATVRSAQNTANMALFMWGSAPLVLVGVDLTSDSAEAMIRTRAYAFPHRVSP